MENGSYDLEGIIWHQHSNHLMKKILELWSDKSIPVLDLGCGMNYYCSVLQYAGYEATGIDGVDLKGVDRVYDITDPELHELLENIGIPYKKNTCNVLSLEVGEHLPAHLSASYLDNICSFGEDVIMSWAIPGQEGIGHINCKTNEEVISEMRSRGLIWNRELTEQLRSSVANCHCDWFRNTLLYFQR